MANRPTHVFCPVCKTRQEVEGDKIAAHTVSDTQISGNERYYVHVDAPCNGSGGNVGEWLEVRRG